MTARAALQVPTQPGRLSKIHVGLKLHQNCFSGTLPSELGRLSLLQIVSLHSNKLSGTLPTQFGGLSEVSGGVVLSDNDISGTIPSQIGQLSKLEYFSVQENKLSGTIPDVYASLSELNLWDTFNNKLEGDLPSSICLLPHLPFL